jgi:hypothetical protein
VYYHLKRVGEGGIALSGDVRKGQVIGYVTGVDADDGDAPHLHLGIRKGPYKSGTDPRTEKWYYPGYSSIFVNDERDKNDANPLHATIANEWESNPLAYIDARPGGQLVEGTIRGTVNQAVENGSGRVPGGIQAGDIVFVRFTYDATTPPAVINGNFRRYSPVAGKPIGLEVSIRGLTWSSGPRPFIHIRANDVGRSFPDQFSVKSLSDVPPGEPIPASVIDDPSSFPGEVSLAGGIDEFEVGFNSRSTLMIDSAELPTSTSDFNFFSSSAILSGFIASRGATSNLDSFDIIFTLNPSTFSLVTR